MRRLAKSGSKSAEMLMLKNMPLLAATVTVFGCADAPTEVGSASMVTRSTASFGDVRITGGFSLTLVTEIRGTELSVMINDDLTMMTISRSPLTSVTVGCICGTRPSLGLT